MLIVSQNFLLNVEVKEFRNTASIWQRYGKVFGVLFIWLTVYRPKYQRDSCFQHCSFYVQKSDRFWSTSKSWSYKGKSKMYATWCTGWAKKWHFLGICFFSSVRCNIFAMFVYSRIIFIKWRRSSSADINKFCFLCVWINCNFVKCNFFVVMVRLTNDERCLIHNLMCRKTGVSKELWKCSQIWTSASIGYV